MHLGSEIKTPFLEKCVSPSSYLHSQFSTNRRSDGLHLVQFLFKYICALVYDQICLPHLSVAFLFVHLIKKLPLPQALIIGI